MDKITAAFFDGRYTAIESIVYILNDEDLLPDEQFEKIKQYIETVCREAGHMNE